MELADAIVKALEDLAGGAELATVVAALRARRVARSEAGAIAHACAAALRLLDEDEDLEVEALERALARGRVSPALARAVAAAACAGEDEEEPNAALVEARGVPVLQLAGSLGELDDEAHAGLRGLVDRVLAEDCRLVLDLGAAEEVGLELLGPLVSDVQAMRAAGGDIAVCGDPEELPELAARLRLGEVVTVASSGEAAVDHLAGRPRRPTGSERLSFARGAAGGVPVLAPRGPLDERTLAAAEEALAAELAADPRLVLDLGEVPWISAGGLALLATLAGRARAAGGGLRLARLVGPARAQHELGDLARVLPAAATVESAAASFP